MLRFLIVSFCVLPVVLFLIFLYLEDKRMNRKFKDTNTVDH